MVYPSARPIPVGTIAILGVSSTDASNVAGALAIGCDPFSALKLSVEVTSVSDVADMATTSADAVAVVIESDEMPVPPFLLSNSTSQRERPTAST